MATYDIVKLHLLCIVFVLSGYPHGTSCVKYTTGLSTTTQRQSSTQRISTTTQRQSSTQRIKFDYPNPYMHPGKCGRGNEPSLVCDPDGVISKKQADELDVELRKSCEDTPCVCDGGCSSICPGYSMSIALVAKLSNSSSSSSIGKHVHMWAEFLRSTRWDFGSCDNSLVIVLSRDDGKFRTATGPITKKQLNDTCVKAIMDSSLGNFTAHNFSAGLRDLVIKYRTVLNGGDCVWIPKQSETNAGIIISILIALAVVIIILAALWWCFCKRRKVRASWRPPSETPVVDDDDKPHTAAYTDTPDRPDEEKKPDFKSPDGGGGAGGSF